MIKEITNQNLLQLKSTIIQLTQDDYTKPLEVLNGSTIGMHVRHVLEFYECLLKSDSASEINYDLRRRDPKLETNLETSIQCVDDIMKGITAVEKDHNVRLKADYAECEGNKCIAVPSTLFRELLYNIEHTVHHMAIIKIGINHLEKDHIVLDDSFGIAASTIRNKKICAR